MSGSPPAALGTVAAMRKLALVCLLAACGPNVSSPGGDDTAGDDTTTPHPDAGPPGAAQRCQKMDILFVVDDSPSMEQEQSNLASNFPVFADVLDQYMVDADLPLDYRVAVTTTGKTQHYNEVIPAIPPYIPETDIPMSETGDDGAMRETCGMQRRWLERTDTDVRDTFACAAEVGTSGPGNEMPLMCSELALADRVSDGTNAGFLRDDALLAVVYLTDEDDCSRHDDNFNLYADQPCTTEEPSRWVDFFDQLKGGRERWATAVIAAPQDCTSDFGDATAAPRLQAFVAAAGQNAVFSSICDADLAGSLQQALDTFTAACDTFPGPQ